MFKRRRLYRTIEGLLLRLGGLIVLLLILRPEWGHPGDFYLGYPNRFYITQSDVAYPYVSVLWFLWDVILCGTPVFVVIFLLLCGVRRCPFFNHRVDSPKSVTFRSDSDVLAESFLGDLRRGNYSLLFSYACSSLVYLSRPMRCSAGASPLAGLPYGWRTLMVSSNQHFRVLRLWLSLSIVLCRLSRRGLLISSWASVALGSVHQIG